MDLEKRRCIEKIQERRMKKRRAKRRKRAMAFFTAVSVMAVSCGWVYTASANEITLTEIDEFNGVNKTTVIKTHNKNVEKILEKSGVTVSEDDKINVSMEDAVTCDTDIVITRGKQVTVKTNDEEAVVSITKADAREALIEAGYSVDEHDEVIRNGDVIELNDIDIQEETIEEEIPFETETQEDLNIDEGEQKVITEGENGVKEITYSVTYRNGEEASREIISENVTEPVTKVVAIGTKKKAAASEKAVSNVSAGALNITPTVSGVLAAKSSGADNGNMIHGRKYSKKITMNASAYSAYLTGVGTSRTATGTTPRFGVVAVDPRVIPLGSTVYIEGADGSWVYGFAKAEDTGGAIKGNKIDLCFEDSNSQLLVFGRRNCVVYVIE